MDVASRHRVIVLDTETTGLDPADGHRIVEVACVELVNLMPTDRELHFYCNPERNMSQGAFAIHGLSEEFLKGHPSFAEQLGNFREFLVGADAIVAHNAEFDVRFLNAELMACRSAPLDCEVICSLQLARRKFPGSPASLDALCRRFEIDLSERTKHGALIDTRLLARVYLELMGGQQPNLDLTSHLASRSAVPLETARQLRSPRFHAATAEELAAHKAMLVCLTEPLWLSLPERAAASKAA